MWTIEYRSELPVGKRFEVKEGLAHRGLFGSPERALNSVRRDFLVHDEDVSFLNYPDIRTVD